MNNLSPLARARYGTATEIMSRQKSDWPRPVKKPNPSPEFVWETRINEQGKKVLYFPAMWISDIHLGTRHSRPKRLSDMMERTIADKLFAVGDVVDLEYMKCKRSWNFAPWHEQIIAHLLRKDATLFTGNHESPTSKKVFADGSELPRQEWIGQELYGRPVYNEMRYVDPKGRVMHIEHADRFDDVVLGRFKGFWYGVGDFFHNPMADFDTFVQDKTGWDSFSTSATAKKAAKLVINRLGVEKEVIRVVDADPTIDMFLGGHTHEGGIKKTPQGKIIVNDGHCTVNVVQAVVHDRNGTFLFIRNWHKDRMDVEEENGNKRTVYFKDLGLDPYQPPSLIEDVYTEKARQIAQSIFKLAPPKGWKQASQENCSPVDKMHAASVPEIGPVPLPPSGGSRREDVTEKAVL